VRNKAHNDKQETSDTSSGEGMAAVAVGHSDIHVYSECINQRTRGVFTSWGSHNNTPRHQDMAASDIDTAAFMTITVLVSLTENITSLIQYYTIALHC
jgi:hypothetical protein